MAFQPPRRLAFRERLRRVVQRACSGGVARHIEKRGIIFITALNSVEDSSMPTPRRLSGNCYLSVNIPCGESPCACMGNGSTSWRTHDIAIRMPLPWGTAPSLGYTIAGIQSTRGLIPGPDLLFMDGTTSPLRCQYPLSALCFYPILGCAYTPASAVSV